MPDSEVSSLAPSASASNVMPKAQRPGRRERAAAKAGSTSTSNAPRSAAFAKASTVTFQPGKFPVVFDVGVGEPSVTSDISIDVDGYINHSLNVYDAVKSETRFVQFRAESQILDPQSEGEFSKEFVAASLCTLATQVTKSHEDMQLTTGDLGPIRTSEAYHLDSIHTIASQYGEFKVPDVGRRYLSVDFDATIRRIVRAADQIMHDDSIADVSERWWLPTKLVDKEFKFVVATRIQEILGLRDFDVPDIPLIMDALFTGEQAPDWWMMASETDPTLIPVTRLFERTIDDGNDVLGLFGDDPDGLAVKGLLDLPWSNPDRLHLGWPLNVKSAFGDVQSRWALRRPSLDRSFILTTIQSRSGDYFGSTLQLVSIEQALGITVMRVAYAESTPEMSMAVCFPPVARFSYYERLDVKLTSALSIPERRNVWILRDFK